MPAAAAGRRTCGYRDSPARNTTRPADCQSTLARVAEYVLVRVAPGTGTLEGMLFGRTGADKVGLRSNGTAAVRKFGVHLEKATRAI